MSSTIPGLTAITGANIDGAADLMEIHDASAGSDPKERKTTVKDLLLAAMGAYNVRHYGAVGNGTTDDTTAIQAAIDAAIAAGGGIVWFPAGTYKYSALTVTGICTLQGVGQDTSILKKSGATGYGITCSYIDIHIVDLGFQAAVTQTAGAHIWWQNTCAMVSIRHCRFTGGFGSIRNSGGWQTHIEDCTFRDAATGAGTYLIKVDSGNDHYIYGCLSDNDPAAEVEVGIWITNCGCVNITDTDLIHNTYAMLIDAKAADGTNGGVACVWCKGVYFDTGGVGVKLNADSGENIIRCDFDQCWMSSGYSVGVYTGGAGTVDDIRFRGCQISFNASDGVHLDTGTRIAFDGCSITGNSSTGSGISITAAVTHVRGIGNLIGASGAVAGQAYGVFVDDSASNILFTANDLTGNTTAAIHGSPSSSILTGNLT